MHFSTIAHAALALSAVASANPLGKRVYVTDIQVVTKVKTITVTLSPGQETPTAAPVQSTAEAQHTYSSSSIAQQAQQLQQQSSPAPAPKVTIHPNYQGSGQDQDQTDGANVVNHAVQAEAWTSVWVETLPASPVSVAQTPAAQPETQPAASAASAAAPSSYAVSKASNSYQKMVLDSHNVHRANHSAPALEWSSDLEASARLLAQSCNYGHNTNLAGGHYGQNIGFGVSADHVDRMLTNMMYNDEEGFFAPYYGQANPGGNFEKYGHFTQIVWKETTHVGCVTYTCPHLANSGSSQSLDFTVCNYRPTGNISGKYGENVEKPAGHPLVRAA